MAERRCVDCGVDISARGSRAKRCEAHALKEKKAVYKAWYAANLQSVRENARERSNAWYAVNHEKAKVGFKAYRKANAEKMSEYKRIWKAANREKANASARNLRALNPKKANAQARAKRLANLENVRAQARSWAKANPHNGRASSRNYRARKLRQIGHVSQGIEHVLLKMQQNMCAAIWCGKKIGPLNKWHLDHIMPLVLDGLHDDSNLQILCAPCNQSKNAKHPDDWLKEHGELPLERTGT